MKSILKTEFANTMKIAADFAAEFPWDNKVAYASWLAQTYYFVRHSSRLLALGAASTTLEEEALHKRMCSHLKEEMGHDKVAALDLKHLGFDLSDLPEFAVTRAFYQNQYYSLQNLGAASFLGWILFLEGFAASQGPEIYRKVSAAYGPKGTHFVKLHAEEDQEHIEKALAITEGLSHTDETLVIANMKQSAELYKLMLSQALTAAKAFDEASTRQSAHAGETAKAVSMMN